MDRITIGKITSSHGLAGFAKVKSFSGETEHFLNLEEIDLKIGERCIKYQVEQVRPMGDRGRSNSGRNAGVLMKLKGIDSPEAVKSLSGAEVWVDRRFASNLEIDEYYMADLCRCGVFQRDRKIGFVRSVVEAGGHDILEVQGENGKTHMIPFTRHFVGEVSLTNGKITVEEGVVID